MVGHFERVHTKAGNLYRGVGLLDPGREPTATTPEVKGQVKGPEHGEGKKPGSASPEDLTEEELESASTTRHPPPSDGMRLWTEPAIPSSKNRSFGSSTA